MAKFAQCVTNLISFTMKEEIKSLLEEISNEREKAGRLSLVALTEEEKQYAYGKAMGLAIAEKLIRKFAED